MPKFEVSLNRIHKSSPYNCSGYIPEIECENVEEVINSKEVHELINTTYGKRFTLQVSQLNTTYGWEYEISKSKALLPTGTVLIT